MEGSVIWSKRLTPTRVGKMASKCLLLLLMVCVYIFLLVAINEASVPWGINCLRYEIRDIILPEKIRISMQSQVEAERRKRAAILESEGMRQSEVNMAEGKRLSIILASEADKQANINRAVGECCSL